MFLALAGALVGFGASQSRGFSPVVGVIAGLVLGGLSPLLFLLGKPQGAKLCPHCAERVKAAARVCRHCGRSLLGGAAHAR